MANNIDIFEWRSLTKAVNKIIPASTFLIDKVFKTKNTHFADTIDIELITGSSKLARFVNKEEGPQLVSKNTRQLLSVKLPRIYEKKVFTADELGNFKTAGDVYAGSAQDVGRLAEEYKLSELAALRDRIRRRNEWMAAKAITTGAISISQDNIDLSYSFDFHAGASNQLVTLTGTSLWTDSGSDIVANIRTWKRNIFKKTGASATIGLLGTTAAGAFISDSDVQGMLDKNNIRMGAMDLNQQIIDGATYIGRVLGIDWYEYSYPYTDDSGSSQEAFDVNRCVLIAPDDSFRLHYGPVYRFENGGKLTIQAEEVVMPVIDSYKSSLEWTIETKPLTAIHNRDRVISAKVV